MAVLKSGIELANLHATVRFARDVALALKPGDCLCLSGDLGAGKSTFARALIRTIADDDELEVPSPTFTLVQTYELRLPIAHFDLYRISSPDELDELGLDEALAQGVAVIEWPQQAQDMLPLKSVSFMFTGLGDSRSVSVSAPDDFAQRLARSRAARHFLTGSGYGLATRRYWQGDASSRIYETIVPENAPEDMPARILMNAPHRPNGPPIRDGLPYSQIAHLAEDVTPFVAIADWLRHAGFAVPEILAQDLDQGFLLMENLGSEGILDADGQPMPERYNLAIDCLVALHAKQAPTSILVEDRIHKLPAYDARAMQIEVELLIDWYLPHQRGDKVEDRERDAYLDLWRDLFKKLETAEKSLVLRDYHSPNLIWRAGKSGLHRLGIIDFQDALIGPSAYDVASLCQDARVSMDPALSEQLFERYVSARRKADAGFDAQQFREAYVIMAAQRAAKILGIFVRLHKRDGKPQYLRYLPQIEAYLALSLAHPLLEPLRFWCAQAGIGKTES